MGKLLLRLVLFGVGLVFILVSSTQPQILVVGFIFIAAGWLTFLTEIGEH